MDSHGAPGIAIASGDGAYLDADPVVLDLYGVTLDVLRDKRIGDFSPTEYAGLEQHLWSLWVTSGLDHAEGGGTVLRPDGVSIRVWVALDRLPDDSVRITVRPVDEPVKAPPSLRVQDVLGHWRDLERDLVELPPDDPGRQDIEDRIDALRDEYQRRVSGR
jgi:PAS domain-containing protein